MAESFSSAIRLRGLDDYLNPAEECVLPLLQQHSDSQTEKNGTAPVNTAEAAGAVGARVRPATAAARRRAQQRTEALKPHQAAAVASALPVSSEPHQTDPTVFVPATSAIAAPAVVGNITAASGPAPATAPAAAKQAVTAGPAPAPSPTQPEGAGLQAPDGGVSRVGKISLSDCLSCSGCLTSAEGILLTQQSVEQFTSLLSRKQNAGAYAPLAQQQQLLQDVAGPKVVAVSLSSQSVAAVAHHFGCSADAAAGRLSSLFRLLGADFVFSMAAAEALALLETQKEFVGRMCHHMREKELEKRQTQLGAPADAAAAAAASSVAAAEAILEALLPSSGPLPLITSYCPGVVLYAEKSLEAPLLSFLSRVRSAQQIQGLLCKSAVRATVEAQSFLLALKAHAWPRSVAIDAGGPGQSAPTPKVRSEGYAPWALLRLLLTRSPYACYARDAAAAAPAATVASQSSGLLPEEFLHVCVMPCFDKKLEAARPDFGHSGEEQQHQQHDRSPSSFLTSPLAFGASQRPWSEVDMVLATSELPLLLQIANTSFDSLAYAPLDCLVPGTALRLVAHSLRRAAAAGRTSADTAAPKSLPSNPQTAESPFDGDEAAGIASAHAAEEAAAEAEASANVLPSFPFSPGDAPAKCKGGPTGIARPTAVLAGSGGYLEFLFLQTARGFFRCELSPDNLEFARGPNEELQSLAVFPQHCTVGAESAGGGKATVPPRSRRGGLWSDRTPALLRGAFAYGFRNIQNVAQQLRLLVPMDSHAGEANITGSGSACGSGECGGHAFAREDIGTSVPHLVEIGACPGGCLNGGGQAVKNESVEVPNSSFSSNQTCDAPAWRHKRMRENMTMAVEPKVIGKNREPLTSLTRLLHAEFELLSPQAHPLVLPAYIFLFGCCYGESGHPAAAAALGKLESFLQQTESTKIVERLLCSDSSSSLPARFWLAPRVTAVFRTGFKPAKDVGRTGATVSISDLKW